MAHADVSAAGLKNGFAGAVCLECQVFRLGLGKAFDPVVEGVVRHRVPHGAPEAVAAVPLFAIPVLHIGIVADDGVKGLPGVVGRTGGDEKFVHRQIFMNGNIRTVFAGPVPAAAHDFFQKFIDCIEGPHGNERASGDHARRDGRIVAP